MTKADLMADADLGVAPQFSLADLVRADQPHQHALPESLGDGAVLSRVAPLARQRAILLGRGYRFLPDESFPQEHRLIPSLQLLSLLRARTIPYRRTRLAVEQVLATSPQTRFEDEVLRSLCIGSYTFHEGSHALFYELVRDAEGELSGRRLTDVLLASEGFAIAFDICSLLYGMAVDPRRSTRMFLALNISADPFAMVRYEKNQPGIGPKLQRLIAEQPATAMRFASAACLISILRPTAAAAKLELIEYLSSQAGLEPKYLEEAKCLMAIALNVDATFRTSTNTAFFEHVGLTEAYDFMRAQPLERVFEAGSALHDHLGPAIACVFPPAGAGVVV